MNIIAHVGEASESAHYANRPTVKVIIRNGNDVLLLNDGLLPGGGVEPGESDEVAARRELQEELGVSVRELKELGTVVQYRAFLEKRYLVKGYVATLESATGATDPQDEGEAQFIKRWMAIDDALAFVANSISRAQAQPQTNDAAQGRLYNLMTTHELLKARDVFRKHYEASSESTRASS